MHIRNAIRHFKAQIKTDRKAFILYSILRALTIMTLIRCLMFGNYESAALCVLSLLLFFIPAFFETRLKIQIPTLFEMIIYLFIFAAEILGEINHYYVLLPGWDTMLHTLNGFLCAAVGFSLVDLLNQRSDRLELSPLYLTLVAFCFSMTVGVLWEFFEFAMDSFFHLDMQKDFFVRSFGSVTLDPTHTGTVIRVSDITDTVIHTASGVTYELSDGYLDIGLLDTMKDLLVNFVGAVAFSFIGFFYVQNRDKTTRRSRIAEGLLIRKQPEDDTSASAAGK